MLVDWNMPEMNGLEFIQRRPRASAPTTRVRILMVTTETESEQVIRALDAGANEYVMKPFTKDVLVAKLQPARRVRGVSACRKIRVLVVDDAVVVRRLVADELSARPGARGGRHGGQRPDRAGEDGAGEPGPGHPRRRDAGDGRPGRRWRELRKTYPRLPVIMFSTLTERGAAATLDALALGASDYVTKPASVGGARRVAAGHPRAS